MMMIFTGEHDVGDHPDAPEVGVQWQGLVVHHLMGIIVISLVHHLGIIVQQLATILIILANVIIVIIHKCQFDYFGKCDYVYHLRRDKLGGAKHLSDLQRCNILKIYLISILEKS